MIPRALALAPILLLAPVSCQRGASEKERAAWEEEKARLERDITNTRESVDQRERQLLEQMEVMEKSATEARDALLKDLEQAQEATRQQLAKVRGIESELAEAKSLLAQAGISLQPKDGAPVPDPRELAAASRRAAVTIEGDVRRGAGVLVREEGRIFLYTAAHVLSGNRKLTITDAGGTKLTRFGELQLAGESDLARLEVKEDKEPPTIEWAPEARVPRENMGLLLPTANEVGISAVLGQPVPGQPVEIMGGRDRVPGTMVLDQNDAALLGILIRSGGGRSGLFEIPSDPVFEAKGVFLRPAAGTEWKGVSVGAFLAEGRALAAYDHMTRLAMAVATLKGGEGAIRFEGVLGTRTSPLEVLGEHKEIPAVAELLAVHAGTDTRKIKLNEQDARRKLVGTLNTIAASVRQSGQDFDPAKFTGFHRSAAKQSAAWRASADQSMREAIQALEKP